MTKRHTIVLSLLIAGISALPAVAEDWASADQLYAKQMQAALDYQKKTSKMTTDATTSGTPAGMSRSAPITNINQIKPNMKLGQNSDVAPPTRTTSMGGARTGRLSDGLNASHTITNFNPRTTPPETSPAPGMRRMPTLDELKAQKEAQVLRYQAQGLFGPPTKLPVEAPTSVPDMGSPGEVMP